jgi:two-component system, OmpR family, sensor histidine kinase KdpD
MIAPSSPETRAGSLRPGRRRLLWREYLEVLAVIAAVTVVGSLLRLNYRSLGQIYLLAVVALSLRVGRGPVLAAAVVSAVAWNFVFIPPRFSFHVFSREDALLLETYFAVALIAGQLTARIRWREAHFAQSELHRTLLDSVSHELKTPLAVLRTATERLDAADPAKLAALTAEIRTATGRLDRLVANLLGQTRLESGGIRARLDWCDARDLINAARRAAGESLAGRELRIEVPPDLPVFRADATLTEQAIANLLVNASLHGGSAGPIEVSAALDPAARQITIAVADRGPGIPPGRAESLFQKFQRGAGAPAGGVGLGLSIARGFLQAQGGAVTARNRSGGGAEFTVYLPYSPHGNLPDDEG